MNYAVGFYFSLKLPVVKSHYFGQPYINNNCLHNIAFLFGLVKQKCMRSASDLFSINCHLFTLNPITNLSQGKTLFHKFSFFKIIKNTTTELVTLTANQILCEIDGF